MMWMRIVSCLEPLEAADPLHGRRGKLLDAFESMARASPRAVA